MRRARILLPATLMLLLSGAHSAGAQTTISPVVPQNPITYSTAPTTPAAPSYLPPPTPGVPQVKSATTPNPLGSGSANNSGVAAAAAATATTTPTSTTLVMQPDKVTTGFDQNGQPLSDHYYATHPHTVSMALVREPGLQPGQVMLHLAAGNPVTGCPKIGNMPHRVQTNDYRIAVSIGDYMVDLRDLQNGDHHVCPLQAHTPTADILLDRDMILRSKIRRLSLQVNDFPPDYYNIHIDQNHIWLEPSEIGGFESTHFRAARVSTLYNPLIHWFYPKNTVVLYVPGAKQDQNSSEAIDTMARANGLTPLQSEWPDFKSPLTQKSLYFYLDKKGRLTGDPAIAQGIVAGTIPTTKTVYGLEKDETVESQQKVFARTPAEYE